jgi:hypothetical protein
MKGMQTRTSETSAMIVQICASALLEVVKGGI